MTAILGEYFRRQLSLEEVLLGGRPRDAAPARGVQLGEGRLPLGEVGALGHDPPAREPVGVPQQLLVQSV